MRLALVGLHNDRCYGLRTIASYLRERGHEFRLIIFKEFRCHIVPDAETETWRRILSATYPPLVEPREEGNIPCPYVHPTTDREWEIFLEQMTAFRPDLIGLSVATPVFDVAREMTKRIHRELPGVPVIWGGPHPTICPEESLRWADLIALGEAEETMAELCADFDRTDIRGLWRRRNGGIVQNPLRPLEQDLDRFPFAVFGEHESMIENDTLVDLPASNKGYFRFIYTIMTQRGCPFQCTYCIHHCLRTMHRGERYFRRRSVENVLAECEQRKRDFDMPGFAFYDDVFVIEPRWIAEFCEKYPRRIGLPFGGYCYPVAGLDQMFRLLKQAGMAFAALGIQTGSDYIGREIYGRKYDNDAIVRLAETVHQYGIAANYEILTNCPYESEADCRATLDLILRMPKALDFRMKKIVFFPGTKINTIDRPRHNLPENVFDFYNQLYLIASHKAIPAEAMRALAEDAYLKANPRLVQAIALALRRAVDEANAAKGPAPPPPAAAPEEQPTWRGFLRYGKRLAAQCLPAPVAHGLRSILRGPKPPQPAEQVRQS